MPPKPANASVVGSGTGTANIVNEPFTHVPGKIVGSVPATENGVTVETAVSPKKPPLGFQVPEANWDSTVDQVLPKLADQPTN